MAKKADKFARFKAARAAHSSLALYEDDDYNQNGYDLYDEVDEEEYRKHKRDQLLKDDFVVDDNGEGYVDNGVDEWDTKHNYYSDEEEDQDSVTDIKGKKKRIRKVKKSAGTINLLLKTSALLQKKKIDTSSVDDILNDFDIKPKVSRSSGFDSVKKSNNNIFSNFGAEEKKRTSNMVSLFKDDDLMTKKLKTSSDVDISADYSMMSDNLPPSSPTKAMPFKKENVFADDDDIVMKDVSTSPVKHISSDDDNDDEDDDVLVTRRPRAAGANISRSVNLTAKKESLPVKKELVSSSPIKLDPTTAVAKLTLDEIVELDEDEENPSFKFFWMDFAEVEHSLLLFGKVLTKKGDVVSGMVQINNLAKELYFLPRQYRKVDDEDTDEVVGLMDVHEEIVPLILAKYGLDSIKAKPEKRKYAFELPGIPREETEYLKLLLPFKTPKNSRITLPADLEGETFHHVFGTNTNIFESFVVQKNVMGPCWLEIKNGNFEGLQNTSHSKVEVSIDNLLNIKVLHEQLPPPSLNVISINIEKSLNLKANKQEIAAVSLAIFKDLPQDAPIPEDLQPDEVVTLVRTINGVFPPGLVALAKQQNFPLRTFNNEKTLLNCLCALIKVNDPDVFIGHRLEAISLDVLVHRMHDLQIPTWSNFGRRNRKNWPERFGNNKNLNSLQIREIFQGRLLCDIANELGQSLTSKCQSWDLPEMYEIVCKKKSFNLEVNFNSPKISEDANTLMMNLKEVLNNSLHSAEIAFATQILSLSKQLTNLAGNAWSHTLGGTRAGRNEYILLHEFSRNGYILPDKESRYNKTHGASKELNDNEEDATTATSNKKPKYQGGLVFEPEKGLHKNIVLVMDFNSLYPSIIQEFNICFTTVDRSLDNPDDLPNTPPRDSQQGVLPRLLATLVSRRREVKKLLKDSKATPFEKAQYDIKQQALKLTANSMYGCLGYVHSRFYAKPLAMLVTNKGREILMDTRQLAESLGLRVIYGDTDSVMIDSGTRDINEALKIGEEFKLKVNERYKLLEIDTDNVFKRILLHAKKKYAAMNVAMVNGKEIVSLEVKGLDMKRREYCQLSKDVSTFILNKLLLDDEPEESANEIYAYLEEMTLKMKLNEIRVDKFAINTRLSKDPKQYAAGKSMPSVQVALRLRDQGKMIKAGSVITFVISQGDKETDLQQQQPAERARALQEMLKNKDLKPDFEYYSEKQIYAPVERLVERIESIDLVRIAKCLGLDFKKYEQRARNNMTQSLELQPLESTITDAERFRDTQFLELQCSCGFKFKFGGLISSKDYKITHRGIQCSRCSSELAPLRINSQLERIIRAHISLYYAGWLICDDPTCGITTRQISVYGRRCIGISGKAHGCKGIMKYRYSDKQLYNQLLYLESVFDVDKAKSHKLKPLVELEDEDKENANIELTDAQLAALSELVRPGFDVCRGVVNKYLNHCGRRFVDMGSMFGFMSAVK